MLLSIGQLGPQELIELETVLPRSSSFSFLDRSPLDYFQNKTTEVQSVFSEKSHWQSFSLFALSADGSGSSEEIDLEAGQRNCLDTGAERSLIRESDPDLEGDRRWRKIGLNLAAGGADKGDLWMSGEIRKSGVFDNLLAVGRAIVKGAKFVFSKSECIIELPNAAKPIRAKVSTGGCPYVSSKDAFTLREFMRDDTQCPIVPDVQLALVIQSTHELVDYTKFFQSEISSRWEKADRKPRTFLASFLESTSSLGGDSHVDVFAFQNVLGLFDNFIVGEFFSEQRSE